MAAMGFFVGILVGWAAGVVFAAWVYASRPDK